MSEFGPAPSEQQAANLPPEAANNVPTPEATAPSTPNPDQDGTNVQAVEVAPGVTEVYNQKTGELEDGRYHDEEV